MIRTVQKKSYSKRKTEDYRLQRKLKFVYSRILKVFYALLLVAFIAFMVWVLKFEGDKKIDEFVYQNSTKLFISMGLNIKSVEIQGNKIVPTNLILDKIFESLGEVSKKSLILLDLENLNKNLTSIGWVESVSIKKKMPGTLIITVNERSPKVIWQSAGQVWLANDNGDLLTQQIEKKYIYLPVILGHEPSKDIPELFKIVHSSKKLSPLVSGASKIGGRRWDITLSNGIKVMLPEENPVNSWKKLEELDGKNAILSKKINYVDMRIENQLTTGLNTEQKNEVSESKKSLENKNGQTE